MGIDIRFFDDLKIDIVQHHRFVERSALVVILVKADLDRSIRSDNHFHGVAGAEAQIVDGVDVGRITHGDNQGRASAINRNQVVFLRNLCGDEFDDRRVDFKFTEVDRRDTILLGKERGEDFFFY